MMRLHFTSQESISMRRAIAAGKPLALRFTEVTEDDLHLEGAELLAAFDVLGVDEVGHEYQ